MENLILSGKCVASFRLGGEKISLVPSEMERDGDTLAKKIGGLTARLAFELPHNLWTLSFENCGDSDSPRVSDVRSADVDIPGAPPYCLHTLRGDDCSSLSFMPIDLAFNAGESYTVKPNGGRSSCTTGFPYLDVTSGGSTALFSIGWTGQWLYKLTFCEDGYNFSAGLEYADFFLKPGEKVRCPAIFAMDSSDAAAESGVSGGIDAAATRRSFKRVLFRDFNPVRGYGKDTLPFSIQSFDRYFHKYPKWETVGGQIETLEGAVKCEGFDTLWIDAAWFRNGFPNGVGNYTFEKGFPDGLKPVSDAVHAAGMRFMVWFEPERVYEGSEVFENHQEFLLTDADPCTRLYNLGDPAAWDWMHATLRDFIRANGIDNYRQDFNMEPLGYWLKHDEPGRAGITEMKYIEGLYRLWDALAADFPGLFIDDCSSGGRRIDFEMMRRGAPMWRSDTNCGPSSPERHTYTWNQNNTLELGEYIAYHAGAIWEPIPYHVRSAATSGLACTFDILNPEFNFDAARAVLGEATRLAPLWTGDFYPLTTPTLDESGFCAWYFTSGAKGVAQVFRRNDCESDTFKLSLAALDRAKRYRVVFTDENYIKAVAEYDGSALADGIDVRLAKKSSSLVVEFDAE